MGSKRTPEEKKRQKRVRIGVAALCVAGAAAAGTAAGVGYTMCYTVEYQGSPIAYVDNKDDIDSAVLRAESITSDLLDKDVTFEKDLDIKKTIVPRTSVIAGPAAADSILEQIPELTRLYTVTVDGTFIGAAENAETITRALEIVKDTYRTPETISIEIESRLELDHKFLPQGTEPMNEEQLAQAMLEPVTRVFPYTTQQGDTMAAVAQRFGMEPQRLDELNDPGELEIEATDADVASLDEIMGTMDVAQTQGEDAAQYNTEDEVPVPEEEPGIDSEDIVFADMDGVKPEALAAQAVREAYAAVDAASVVQSEEELSLTDAPLRPGQQLTVEQTCSRLVVTTVEEQLEEREIQPEKLTLLDSSIPVGTQEILIEGTPGSETVMTRVTRRCGVPVANVDLNSVTQLRAEPLLVSVGYGSHPELYDFFGQEGLMFQWPVQGSISSDYGYRYIFGGVNFHRGVDIPAPMGTAVHAAAGGTVIFAGERGSYGNLVVIDHGNGFETLYGHNSGFLVKAGDVVTRGQSIAAVGSTGRSTGPHCHFEVHLNGMLVDPLMYLPGDNNAPVRMQVPLSELNSTAQETENDAQTAESGTARNTGEQRPSGRSEWTAPAQSGGNAAENPPAEEGQEVQTGEAEVSSAPGDALAEAAAPETAEAPAAPAAPAAEPAPSAAPVSDALADALDPGQ